MQIDSKLIIGIIVCYLIYHLINKIYHYFVKKLDYIKIRKREDAKKIF